MNISTSTVGRMRASTEFDRWEVKGYEVFTISSIIIITYNPYIELY